MTLDRDRILKAEAIFERTPIGRSLSKKATQLIKKTIEENEELIQCLGCRLIFAVSLSSQGCINCGVENLTLQIKE